MRSRKVITKRDKAGNFIDINDYLVMAKDDELQYAQVIGVWKNGNPKIVTVSVSEDGPIIDDYIQSLKESEKAIVVQHEQMPEEIYSLLYSFELKEEQ